MSRLSLLTGLSLPLALLACSDGSSPAGKSAAAPRAAVAQPTARAAPTAPAPADRPENYDARAADHAARSAPSMRAAAFEWRVTAAPAAAKGGVHDPVAAARAYLGLDTAASAGAGGPVDEAVVAGVHDLGRGPVIVQFKRHVGGLEVFGEKTAVAMTRDLRLVARSGNVPAATRPAPELQPFTLSAPQAIAAALTDVSGELYAAGDLATVASKTGEARFDLAAATASARGARLLAPARARKALFPLAGALVPAYRVEVALKPAGKALLGYAYVVSAVDGAVLMRRDQVQSEAFSYRVWAGKSDAAVDPYLPYDGPVGLGATPSPTGTDVGFDPGVAERNLVSLQSYPFAHPDPWLAADATVTSGNNVDAYADVSGKTGFDGTDFRAQTTGPLAFDYSYDTAADADATRDQQQAAIVQLFYDNNFFHDWYYDSGFDEASGNAQADNFGRGGQGGDPLHAEAEDSSGMNNANMFTPADGTPPQMQMYLFSGNGPRYVEVTAPAAIAGKMATEVGAFGPSEYTVPGDVAAASPALACAGPLADLTGKIALVDRGICNFTVKVLNAQKAGAIGVIIRNVSASQAFAPMGGTDANITIPSMLVQLADGKAIGEHLGDGVAVTLYRPHATLRDGALDNLIVAHEWGHFISNRLVGDGEGLESRQAGGLGEGWGDTHALLLAVRAADADVASNTTWNGTYGLSGWADGGTDWQGNPNDGYYFGVRRVPYSTDMLKDPLTFKHITDGVPLSANLDIPIASGRDGAGNSEVHNTGEVWATMLWECYASLLRETQGANPTRTFDQARDQWKDYLVAAYKLTPLNPTLLEARDALLAAAYATSPHDFNLFWQAFAKRGAGVGAVGPDKWFSPGNEGVVESYQGGPKLTVLASSVTPAAGGCTDGDAYLDSGESGTIHLTVRNDGAAPLPALTAALSVNVKALQLALSTLAVPAIDPGKTATLDVEAAVSAQTIPADAIVSLTFAQESELAGAVVSLPVVLNRDEAPASSASDGFTTVESGKLWTVGGTLDGTPTGEPGWTKQVGGFWAHDVGHPATFTLTSPPLVVGDGDFHFTVRHNHDLEGEFNTTYRIGLGYDYGLVEVKAEDEETWHDAAPDDSDLLTYDGYAYPTEAPAFVYLNPSFPDDDVTLFRLGTDYAGKKVQVRFRLTTDEAVGGSGWVIHDVSFGGITNTPFATLKLDAGTCLKPATSSSGGSCATGPGTLGFTTLLLAAAALALRLPRRRRALK